jgi:PAS domain S-box-containing protein
MLQDAVRGKARECEVRWRTRDGAIVHFDGASVPRLSSNGEFLSTLCTLRDVTERKCAEEKLRKSEEKYRDLIEISPDAIYVVDAQGICVLGNRAGAELAGVPWDELVGTPVTETYLPEEHYLFQERLEKLKAKGTLRFERKFVRKNGEIVPVEVSLSAIRGGYFQAILRDISERKRAEALFTGEKRLLEMIATGVALKEILNALCLIIEEFRSGTLASVLLLNPDGLHLDSVAGPSLPKGWTQQMETLPIGPCAGSCGTAAYRGSPVIVSDIATDPLWDVPEHRASALKHGLRASWSNPVLSSEGKVLGTFCIYYREPKSELARSRADRVSGAPYTGCD